MGLRSSLRLVDTHCHLNLDEFDADRAQVIERARQEGVDRILIPGLDVETSQAALDYAKANTDVYAAVGFHPNTTSP